MSLRITKRQLTLGGLAVLSAVLVQTAQAAVVAGTSRTVTRDLVVKGTAEASISITPRDNILAGNYNYFNQQMLATWSAEVTGATVAFRFNPTVVDPYGNGSNPTVGYLKKTGAPTQRLSVIITNTCSSSVIGTWRVCSEGTQKVSGGIKAFETQTITGGSYPVAMDAVAWLY